MPFVFNAPIVMIGFAFSAAVGVVFGYFPARKAARRGEYSQVSVTDIPLPDLDPNPADYLERKELLERLALAVGQLGERCREMIRLKLQGKTFAQIQEIMGAGAINTVYTWDHRCRKHLLELMGGDWEPGKR